jgi:light-regulated signal transduction histidine kinase (bacteriophytochrome)
MLLIVCVVAYLIFKNNKKTKLLNREITEQKEEIQAQSEELVESNQIISAQNETLRKIHDEITAQNEELIQSQEEISAQRDLVTEQNRKLGEARLIIEKQHEEIKQRNENLEEQVDKRTKELVEYNQQLEQFAFISSHNLRAPVARILGLGQLMELSGKSAQDEELIHKSLISTTRELDRVVRDLNTILEIKKTNTSVLTEIDLNEELKLIRINLEKEILETNAEVIADFSRVNSIQSIRPYLDSILVNLISNSIKYRHPHRSPIIKLKTELAGSFIKLTVEDNGLGIDLALCRDKVFTLYSRFHNHVEGKGLGLYLVKTQVTAMGGRIDVESELNRSLTFHIYLKADFKQSSTI